MKAVLLSMLIAVTFANAQEASLETNTNSDWRLEAYYASFAMRNTTSPNVGASAIYEASDWLSLGLKCAMSLDGKPNEGLASLGLIERIYVYRSKTSLFIELSQNANIAYKEEEFSSAGMAFGMDHKVFDNFLIGGLAGFERDFGDGLEDDSEFDPSTYPKISVLVGVSI